MYVAVLWIIGGRILIMISVIFVVLLRFRMMNRIGSKVMGGMIVIIVIRDFRVVCIIGMRLSISLVSNVLMVEIVRLSRS